VRNRRCAPRILAIAQAPLVMGGMYMSMKQAPSGTAPATRIAPYRRVECRRSTRMPATKFAMPSQTEAIM